MRAPWSYRLSWSIAIACAVGSIWHVPLFGVSAMFVALAMNIARIYEIRYLREEIEELIEWSAAFSLQAQNNAEITNQTFGLFAERIKSIQEHAGLSNEDLN